MWPLAAGGPLLRGTGCRRHTRYQGRTQDRHRGRMLDTSDRPSRGFTASGNCVASASGRAYWAGGATLGPIVAFAYRAANARTPKFETTHEGLDCPRAALIRCSRFARTVTRPASGPRTVASNVTASGKVSPMAWGPAYSACSGARPRTAPDSFSRRNTSTPWKARSEPRVARQMADRYPGSCARSTMVYFQDDPKRRARHHRLRRITQVKKEIAWH
jgi:hypothetical protein